jgi:Subtilase family
MAKRKFLSVLAVSATGAALLGGVPAVVIAATAGGAGATSSPEFGSMTPALATQLSQNADKPVIVVLKSQLGQAAVGSTAGTIRSAAVSASQAPLMSELNQVNATSIKQYTLVNSVSATVSALEEQRLAASPAVAAVIPDATVTIPAPVTSPAATTTAASPERTTSRPIRNIAGACAPKGKSQLAPEGLALTGAASGSAKQATARTLGFTGAGVKVAFIADGLDPKNVNFLNQNGKSVFADYQDFTGNGAGAQTTGGEAFLDANTIAGQGTHVYNLNGFAAQGYPGSCDVKIQGVAPGASLVGLDIFSGDPNHTYVTTNSMIAEAINYAVEHDHVNVINESFGGNPFPDTAQDVVKLFNDAAVKAGVVVSVSSGDSGTTSTIGSPSTDPHVLSVGATTQFQMYAQSNYGLPRYFAKGWLSNNISGLSSSGYDEAGATVSLVAPGDLSWASCDASAKFSECTNLKGKPSSIEISGGTSESSPFVAGAAALVIQAYKKTHGNHVPSPAVVKQILLSTATDLSIPAQEQGAGLLNAYKAVELAESYGLKARHGSTLLASTGQLTHTGLPGSSKSWSVTLTNSGAKTQQVSLHGRTLGPDQNEKTGTVTLNNTTSNQVTDFAGFKNNYALVKFTVPAGQSRLDFSIAYTAGGSVFQGPVLALIDPKGRYAANSDPQGLGDYGNVDVRTPAAGTWTAVISDITGGADGGYTGAVNWQAVTERYQSLGTVSPSSFSLAPGASKKVTFTAAAPAAPGDSAGSLAISSNLGGATSIPVTVRSMVNVASGGAFTGVLTGGNGRGSVGQNNFYSFNVPAGTPAISASVLLSKNPANGIFAGAYLVSPDGNVLGSGQNYDIGTSTESGTSSFRTLDVTALSPDQGTWTLIVDFDAPTPGSLVTDPFTGQVTLLPAGKITAALPAGATLAPGVADTIPVTITNNGTAPEDYFLDPRLTTITTMTLAPLTSALSAGSNTSTLPLSVDNNIPAYFVPSQSSSISVKQTSTVPAMTDLSPAVGDPDVASAAGLIKAGSLCHFNVSAGYAAAGKDLTPGLWSPLPTECGPFAKAAKSGKATDTVTVRSRAFDSAMTVGTGDLMQAAKGAGAVTKVADNLVEVAPGASITVNVSIKPSGKAGTVVKGTLYLDDLAIGVPPAGLTGVAEVTAVPYSYTIG